jgi:hypothetical protein
MDRAVSDAFSISKHDNWEAGRDDHLKQSVVGTFKMAEVATFSIQR